MHLRSRYTPWYTLLMSALLKIKDEDNERIEKLQRLLAKESKVDVVREALMLLEEKIQRDKKIERYRRAAQLAAASSAEINAEMVRGHRSTYED
jgi:hypothetical protein